jgi:Gamma-glutamyl cyclotransferase, AIG2-like
MRLFFYGTMRDAEVRRAVFGERAEQLSVAPAVLPGFRPYRARDGDFPVLVRRTGARVRGQLVDGLGHADLLRLLNFEGPHYRPACHVVIDPNGRRRQAWVLLPDSPRRASAKPWRLRQWQLHRKPRMMIRLRIWMLEFDRLEGHSANLAWPLRRRLEAWRESGDLIAD